MNGSRQDNSFLVAYVVQQMSIENHVVYYHITRVYSPYHLHSRFKSDIKYDSTALNTQQILGKSKFKHSNLQLQMV